MTWTARWISVPDAPAFDYGVYHFRRAFDLPERPARFVVHVSADNRYQLFANGERVASGPARGDLDHWRYETLDLAPHLRAGRNVLAAVVWNFGADAPQAQITQQTGFLLQGDGEAEAVVSTDKGWKATRDTAYAPLPVPPAEIHFQYYVAGPGDRVVASSYPWGWEAPGFDDSAWPAAREGPRGAAREAVDAPSRWMLVPRTTPAMEEQPLRLARVRRSTGVEVAASFLRGDAPFTVPARARATILFDQDHLATAYPELTVSGGRDAVVTLRYAEALFVPGTKTKGNRDEVEGKEVRGQRDVFVADGGAGRRFRPLWWRTYRYLQLEVETADAPLSIEDLAATATGYPFVRKARFQAGEPELERILEVGWRTARLCAHETYMDCPYYEQLQYAGDTRIQALVSLYATGDARLMRNALELLDTSRTADGLTLSRAPTRLQQYIPPFSLWWIGMLHDYWRYQDDPDFVRHLLPGVRAVLAFFAERQEAGRRLRTSIQARYWDAARGLYADTPTHDHFSQHANVLAVLASLVEGAQARAVMDRVLADPTLVPCSIYFRHYLHAALNRAGEGDRYLELLSPWREMLAVGLTTWAETNDPEVRSDCHAWGASPNFELFRTVLGIDSAAPGFHHVIIRPFLGRLAAAAGSIPHPRGEISVALRRTGDRLDAEVVLPPGVDGDLVWRAARRALPSGRSKIALDGGARP
jgi:hypothetical protein